MMDLEVLGWKLSNWLDMILYLRNSGHVLGNWIRNCKSVLLSICSVLIWEELGYVIFYLCSWLINFTFISLLSYSALTSMQNIFYYTLWDIAFIGKLNYLITAIQFDISIRWSPFSILAWQCDPFPCSSVQRILKQET